MGGMQILFDPESIQLFAEAMTQAPQNFMTELEAAVTDSVEILRVPLAQYPGPPSHPIHWDSEKQRRAFFATDGFGGGIPTVRTGGIPSSWHSKVEVVSGRITGLVSSNLPGIPYVQDRNQQSRIHAGRWQTVQGDLEENRNAIIERCRLAATNALGRIAASVRGYAHGGD